MLQWGMGVAERLWVEAAFDASMARCALGKSMDIQIGKGRGLKRFRDQSLLHSLREHRRMPNSWQTSPDISCLTATGPFQSSIAWQPAVLENCHLSSPLPQEAPRSTRFNSCGDPIAQLLDIGYTRANTPLYADPRDACVVGISNAVAG